MLITDIFAKGVYGSFVLFVAAFSFALVGAPLAAQPADSAGIDGVICTVSEAPEGGDVVAMLPARNADSMVAKGFRIVPCDRAFPTLADRERWRDSICELAALPLDYVQEQIVSAYVVTGQELCGLAELATSTWRRPGPSTP